MVIPKNDQPTLAPKDLRQVEQLEHRIDEAIKRVSSGQPVEVTVHEELQKAVKQELTNRYARAGWKISARYSPGDQRDPSYTIITLR